MSFIEQFFNKFPHIIFLMFLSTDRRIKFLSLQTGKRRGSGNWWIPIVAQEVEDIAFGEQ